MVEVEALRLCRRPDVGGHDLFELLELGPDQVACGSALVERVGLRQQVALQVVGPSRHLRSLRDEVVGLPAGRVGGVDVVLGLAVSLGLPLLGGPPDGVALGDGEA